MTKRPLRLRRSVLYVPASNEKAVAKTVSLPCDAVIYDLEDAVAPAAKEEARERLRDHFKANPKSRCERVIRINSLSSAFGPEDFLAARACKPDAILIPKVDLPRDIADVADMLAETDAADTIRLWAMMETPKAFLNVGQIAEWGETPGSRLDCLVAGTNDLAKDLRLPGRDHAVLGPLMADLVLSARAFGLDVLDGVFNAFRDEEGFRSECGRSVAMGFDGKTLIHPGQIAVANEIFGISETREAEANAIVEAFERPENRDAGVIGLDGRMVERLHLEEARRTLALAALQQGG
ncbi:HpcH/HpaI aldolase/citrate lyase family protein [Oricola indica]|jgi:citrate lyase subunit beta/citryl-CoA lyase|uniref:HpcH/HpaI aldolase/citrate lyase family protein n=1 Tax=Oricola indica TaxID=2872591 RepID=UPI001CBE15E5|nr:CoA ester lyase [Oricola indica]